MEYILCNKYVLFLQESSIVFLELLYPTASTCDLTHRLPTVHQNYDQFKEAFIEGLVNKIEYLQS